ATQVTAELTPATRQFTGRMEMAFIATSTRSGECGCSFGAGPAGFIQVLDERTLACPEYRGNGVLASLGNLVGNPHIGVFLADVTRDFIGLHVNGHATLLPPARTRDLDRRVPEPGHRGRGPARWVLVHVAEAHMHCSRHIPEMIPRSRVRHRGPGAPRPEGGYFGVTAGNLAA